jgi:hypothetical protein
MFSLYACVLIVCYYFPVIESSDNECAEEGEVYEYQEEEDQGQATQGKPSTLLHISILILILAYFYYWLSKCICRGDDLWGAPRARQYAGWRPRSPHGFITRRPAPTEGPAAPAAGWRLHRGELEPGDEDKASQRLSGKKQNGPDKIGRGAGQEWRARRPRPTNERSKTLPHDGIRGIGEGICPPDAGPGKRHFIKCLCQSRVRGSCQGRRRRGAGSRPNRHLNL